MPMTTLEYDTLNLAFAVSKTVLTDLQPRLAALQQQYDADGGVGDTLTQEEMDLQPALSGLTKQAADDGLYALTAVLLPAITQGFTALSALASRYRGMSPPPPVPFP
jgi:hypothetical protein